MTPFKANDILKALGPNTGLPVEEVGFKGPQSRTWNMANATLANRMLSQGAGWDEIWKNAKTTFTKAVENPSVTDPSHWHPWQEFSESQMQLHPDIAKPGFLPGPRVSKTTSQSPVMLPQAVWHPELFDAYPELRYLPIDKAVGPGNRGSLWFDVQSQLPTRLSVDPNLPQTRVKNPQWSDPNSGFSMQGEFGSPTLAEIMAHEIQHGIQRIEKTAPRQQASPESFHPSFFLPGTPEYDLMNKLQTPYGLDRYGKIADWGGLDPFLRYGLYRHGTHEQQASNVERRFEMTDPQRSAHGPHKDIIRIQDTLMTDPALQRQDNEILRQLSAAIPTAPGPTPSRSGFAIPPPELVDLSQMEGQPFQEEEFGPEFWARKMREYMPGVSPGR